MSDAVTIFFDVCDGQLRLDNLPALRRWLKTHEGRRGRAILETTDGDRRERLRRLYWKVLREAGEQFGNDPRDQHAQFWLSLMPHDSIPNDIDFDLGKLGDRDYGEYVQATIRVAAEHGCIIGERV